MYQWHAKVHKSGSKVAIFNGSQLVKMVEASSETFEPAEAQKFAEELVAELENRTSAQMTSPSEQPAVATTSELQEASMEVATQQAEGKGFSEAQKEEIPMEIIESSTDEEKQQVIAENKKLREVIAALKNKLSKEKNERVIERKARRGLAIAKQLVVNGSIEDSYKAIKEKVASIVELEDSEIDRLERKVAGQSEFDSIEDAEKELRRQDRIARINRQAAAEAQEDGDEEQADSLDRKADEAEAKKAHIAYAIEEMKKDSEITTEIEKLAEESEEVKEESSSEEKPETEEVKEESSSEEEAVSEEPSEESQEEKNETSEESDEKLSALAREYRMIAANHRKLAEKAETEGDIKTADMQDAMADEAEEKAEDIEKKLAEISQEASIEDEGQQVESSIEPEVEQQVESSIEEPLAKEPGTTVTSSKHNPLKREGQSVEESFGVDKNASLVEQNSYSGDPEVEILSRMWRGAPQGDE